MQHKRRAVSRKRCRPFSFSERPLIETDFAFDVEIDAFEKAGAGEKSRRIGGYVSTADLDKQNEIVLQEGLDFKPFLNGGWFNDNHGRDMSAVLGFPDSAQLVKKGEILPSGREADRNGWYVEGFLLKGVKRADDTWALAQALQAAPSGRRLGFSIEGKVTKRETLNKGTPVVASAIVKNVAITHCPVNDKTALEVLAKSLSVGAPQATVAAGVAAPGSGQPLMPQSLDGCPPKKKKKKGQISKADALDLIKRRYPGATTRDAKDILRAALAHVPNAA